MRPTPVWYHELKNRLFWWLVTKNLQDFFSQGETISDAAEEFHKLPCQQKSLSQPSVAQQQQTVNTLLGCTGCLCHCSTSLSVHFQQQMWSNHSAVLKMPCTDVYFQCSIHKLLHFYFLPSLLLDLRSATFPTSSELEENHMGITLRCMASVKLPCFPILGEVRTHVIFVVEE